MSTITIGVDLAKNVFSACEMDSGGHVLRRQDLRREPFGLSLAQLPADTVVAPEASALNDLLALAARVSAIESSRAALRDGYLAPRS